MVLSPEKEQLLIEQNMQKIYRAVDNFTARHSSDIARVPYEDFVQEVCIAFLQYIRKCDTEEEIQKFPWYSAMGAMRDLVLIYQPVACPKSTHHFSEIVHNMPPTMSLDVLNASTGIEIDGMSKHWVDDKETQIDFDSFMSTQNENMQRIASMRVYGMTMKEIGNQCGVKKSAIKRSIDRLFDKYKDFVEVDEK